jgi:hypothetical protein
MMRLICLALALLTADCQRPQPAILLHQADKAGAALANVVYTGDPDAAPQLVDGFHEIEEYSWRWTAQRFSVVLRPPGGAGESAILTMALALPDAEIGTLGDITLTAAIGPASLSPESYTRPGSYIYTREVPASLLRNEDIRIDFRLDKAMKPSAQDIRELGVIVKSIGLEPR